MTKKNIAIIAVSAVVVAGAAVGAVPLVRHFTEKKAPETPESTTAYVYEDPTYIEPVSEPASETPATDENGSIIATIVDVSKNAQNKKNNNGTKSPTKKTTTKKNTTVEAGTGLVDDIIGPNGHQLLGYRKSAAGYYYTDDKDCWQHGAGYNEFYDNMAGGAGMLIDQVRIRFTYGGKDWMVQFWKGQYGWLFVGAEIGLYTAPAGTYTGATGDANHYNCADKEDWLYMQLDCYFDQNHDGHYVKIFTRPYGLYWWPTGFVKGQLTKYTKPRTELKVKGRITFKSEEMANLYVRGLIKCGFAHSGNLDNLVDDSYYQNGKDVWVLWSTIYHDCFVGYEGR